MVHKGALFHLTDLSLYQRFMSTLVAHIKSPIKSLRFEIRHTIRQVVPIEERCCGIFLRGVLNENINNPGAFFTKRNTRLSLPHHPNNFHTIPKNPAFKILLK